MSFYNNMPRDFKRAVNTIKKYCQNEDCDMSNCKECPYPLSIIRPTDTFNYNVKHCTLICEIVQPHIFNKCKEKDCGVCDHFDKLEWR